MLVWNLDTNSNPHIETRCFVWQGLPKIFWRKAGVMQLLPLHEFKALKRRCTAKKCDICYMDSARRMSPSESLRLVNAVRLDRFTNRRSFSFHRNVAGGPSASPDLPWQTRNAKEVVVMQCVRLESPNI
jgi:hypothetical protein